MPQKLDRREGETALRFHLRCGWTWPYALDTPHRNIANYDSIFPLTQPERARLLAIAVQKSQTDEQHTLNFIGRKAMRLGLCFDEFLFIFTNKKRKGCLSR